MDRWVNHAYHELRQPLAVITGAIETLRAYYERLDEETRSLLLARMRRQTMLLQRVIDQLEQASRLQKGPPEVTPQLIDLRPVIDQLLEDYGPLLDGASVTYERPDDVVAACVEPPAATEILLVLLRNAVDHAPCDQPIMIETIPGTTTVRVSVHDDGAGVPLANRDRIFAYGTRLDDGGRLGLGLFIARGLARDHGGDLTVTQSQLLGGARFDLTLPTDCGQDVELPQ